LSHAKSLALFVAQTPFQLFVVHELAAHPNYAGREKVLLTDVKVPGCGLDGSIWDELVQLEPPQAARGPLKRFQNAHRAVRALLAGRYKRESALIAANLEHPLSNASYAHLRRFPGFQLHVYPEGLANLVPTRWTPKRVINQAGKWVLTRLVGAPFTVVGADLTGSRFAERIYTYAPELIPAPFRGRAVALSHTAQLPPVEPGVLVLGQDLDRFLPNERAERELVSLLMFARERAAGRRLYKPHHHEAPWGRKLARSLGFEIIESPCPVELWLRSQPVSHLVSFGSSALVHVRMMYGDRVEALAYKPRVLQAVPGTSPARMKEILTVFEQVGVCVAEGIPGDIGYNETPGG